jgi:hypothetical protein
MLNSGLVSVILSMELSIKGFYLLKSTIKEYQKKQRESSVIHKCLYETGNPMPKSSLKTLVMIVSLLIILSAKVKI